MKTVATDGATLAYADRGAGPTLLLVHGFPLHGSMWDPVVACVQDRFRVIVPDLRGYGASELGEVDPERGVPMTRYADDLAAVLAAAGVAGPTLYAGFSMGGYIGWQFIKRHGERVGALALINTRAASDTPDARAVRLKMASHVDAWGAEHIARAMLPKLFAPRTISAGLPVVERTARQIASSDTAAIAAAQRGMAARPDETALLASLDVPTAFVVGEHDALSTPAEMRSMAEAAGGELTVVPGAGHMAPAENPDAVADAIHRLADRGFGADTLERKARRAEP